MALILTLDNLGKRYGMLPSVVLEQSNTFDLYIMDMAMTYENYITQKSQNNGLNPEDSYDEKDLELLMKNVKNKHVNHI